MKRRFEDDFYYLLEETRKQIIELKAKLDILFEKLEELEKNCLENP